jgi:hypothetical protein
MNCAYCGKKIGVLRKLQDAEFCSPAHRRAFLKKQEDLALEFLLESRPYREPEPASSATVQPAAEPIPVVAGWLSQPIEPAATGPVPKRNARPRRMSWALILPAGPFAPEPRLSISRFAATGCGAIRSSADARRATLQSAAFTLRGPRPPVAAIRPLWIEPAREAAAGRQHAGFVSSQPCWMRTEARLSKAPAAARFTVAPVFAGTGLALARSAFQLARPTHPRIEWLAKPVAAIERDRRWRRLRPPLSTPTRHLRPASAGFRIRKRSRPCRHTPWRVLRAPRFIGQASTGSRRKLNCTSLASPSRSASAGFAIRT